MSGGRGHKSEELRSKVWQLTKDGYSQTDIAGMCGVTRQRVNAILHERIANDNSLSQRLDRVQYKGVKEYLINNKIAMKTFCDNLGECSQYNGTITRFLYGQTDRISISLIKRILQYTNMTFEEAFSD